MLARRLATVVSTLVVAAGVLFGALLLVPAALGWQRYAIVSGSMTGKYDRGSLVLADVVPVASLRVGEVITYAPPPGSTSDALVTHRIAAIRLGPHGERVFRTKGDANAVRDPWQFTLSATRQARVRLGIPYLGFAVAALSSPRTRMLVIGVPAALIALSTLLGLWRADPEAAGARA